MSFSFYQEGTSGESQARTARRQRRAQLSLNISSDGDISGPSSCKSFTVVSPVSRNLSDDKSLLSTLEDSSTGITGAASVQEEPFNATEQCVVLTDSRSEDTIGMDGDKKGGKAKEATCTVRPVDLAPPRNSGRTLRKATLKSPLPGVRKDASEAMSTKEEIEARVKLVLAKVKNRKRPCTLLSSSSSTESDTSPSKVNAKEFQSEGEDVLLQLCGGKPETDVDGLVVRLHVGAATLARLKPNSTLDSTPSIAEDNTTGAPPMILVGHALRSQQPQASAGDDKVTFSPETRASSTTVLKGSTRTSNPLPCPKVPVRKKRRKIVPKQLQKHQRKRARMDEATQRNSVQEVAKEGEDGETEKGKLESLTVGGDDQQRSQQRAEGKHIHMYPC